MPEFFSQRCRGWMLVVAAVFVLLGGCDRSVVIEHPTDGSYTDPISTFTVRFHKDFQPGTFEANLNGTTITNLFQPAPVGGGVSTASIVYPPNFMDAEINQNQQFLEVDGEFTTDVFYFFGIPTRFTRDTSTFRPPSVRIYRGLTSFDHVLTLKEGETIVATAMVEKAPREPLAVTVTGHPLVSLNDRPAGEDIQLVIQRNDRRARFTVRGIQTGGEVFVVRGIATGYSSAQGRGIVERGQ